MISHEEVSPWNIGLTKPHNHSIPIICKTRDSVNLSARNTFCFLFERLKTSSSFSLSNRKNLLGCANATTSVQLISPHYSTSVSVN